MFALGKRKCSPCRWSFLPAIADLTDLLTDFEVLIDWLWCTDWLTLTYWLLIEICQWVLLQDRHSAIGASAVKVSAYDDQFSYAGTPAVAAASSEVGIVCVSALYMLYPDAFEKRTCCADGNGCHPMVADLMITMLVYLLEYVINFQGISWLPKYGYRYRSMLAFTRACKNQRAPCNMGTFITPLHHDKSPLSYTGLICTWTYSRLQFVSDTPTMTIGRENYVKG